LKQNPLLQILIAYGTHGCGQEFVFGGLVRPKWP